MKRLSLLMLPTVLLLVAVVTGCNDTSKPAFSRIQVSPACGVAPMQVEGYAIVTGGNETGDATGGNNNLDIAWDFGDGHTSSTTLAFNQYQMPGDYNVVATAKDPDGNTASASFLVRVLADSLMTEALSDFPSGEVTTADTIHFDVRASSCEIDPDNPSDYVKMIYRWKMNDADNHVYQGKSPIFHYQDPGEYDAVLAVTFPAWAVTRHDTLHFSVTQAP